MRWIFLTLVFGNVVLLAYFWQKQSVSAPTQVVALEIPSGSRQLQLVKELSQPLVPIKPAQRIVSDRAELCYAAGPFLDEAQAQHLQARGSALGFSGRINTVEMTGDEPAEYWVYVPPRASREDALRVLRELQGRKFDSYIITQGELAEGISLGLFRNKDRADSLKKSIEAVGIAVDMRAMNKMVREHWVEITETAQLTEQIRDRIRAGEDGTRWELIECKKG